MMSSKSFQKVRNSWFIGMLSRKAILKSLPRETAENNEPLPHVQTTDSGKKSSQNIATEATTQDKQQASEFPTSESQEDTKSKKDVNKLKADSFNRELFRVRASRLVDFFPNELIIREKSISVVRRDFLVSKVETWNIDDIGEVTLTDAPVYDSLHVVGKFPEHKLDLHGLPKAKATKAKEILDGLVLEDQEQVDLPDDVDTKKRRSLLSRAGKLPEGSGPLYKGGKI